MADEKEQPPGHLAMMSVMSKGYKYYLDHLRKGGKSGISYIFGSASEIFAPPSPPPTPLSEGPQLAPSNQQDYEMRTLYLAYLTSNCCRDFLNGYFERCRDGELGESTKNALPQDIPGQLLNALVKELTCISIYLMMLDQGPQQSVPEWLLDILGGGLGTTDKIISEPPARKILESHASTSNYEVCAKVAANICKQLALNSAAKGAQEPIQQFLFNSGPARHELLKSALAESIEAISKKLAELNLA